MNVRVMTWNVENLFRPDHGSGPSTNAIYQAKLKTLANGISTLKPDVVALQEVGSPEAFSDLQGALNNAYPHAQLSTKPDGRGIRVGFLSKVPLAQPTEIVDFAANPLVEVIDDDGNPIERMRRGALWVRATVGNKTIHLITAHLKSKLLEFPKAGGGTAFAPKDETQRAQVASQALAMRAAEALTLRMQANTLLSKNADQPLIVLGDLNDVPTAATTELLNGPDGSQPGSDGFDRPDKGDDVRLFNLAELIPVDHRYSRITNGVRELIDHILVSEELVPPNGTKRRRPIVDSHPDLQGKIESVSNDPNKRKDKPASDHAPLTATFEF